MSTMNPSVVAGLSDQDLSYRLLAALPGFGELQGQEYEDGPWSVVPPWEWWLDPIPTYWRYRVRKLLGYPNPGGYWTEFALCGTAATPGAFEEFAEFAEAATGIALNGTLTERQNLEAWLCAAEYQEQS